MMTIKSLLLLSVLLLSAGTSKAKDGMSPKEAFIFGTITGVGGLLCSMEEVGEFDKDAARQYFNAWFLKVRNDLRLVMLSPPLIMHI